MVEICVLKAVKAVAIADLLLEIEFIKNKPFEESFKINDVKVIPHSWIMMMCWRRLSGSVGQDTFLLENDGL